MHYAFENFSQERNDDKVIDEVVKLNSQFYKLDLNIRDTIVNQFKLTEGEGLNDRSIHTPHIKNLYKDDTIVKLVAIHILSSRDQIQGGEFKFGKWGQPTRRDNFGKVIREDNPYPYWLNEKGSMFVIPALETFGTHLIVSGKLEYVMYNFRGANYK